ncbi:chromosome segregation atpases protein [Salix suchowensis]|nr:chromosome segregation atpases protein [Salix suchowensis]
MELRMRGGLGEEHKRCLPYVRPEQTWETALESPSFTLVGALDLSNVDLGTNLKLIKIGVKLHAIRTFLSPSEPNALRYRMELFGEMSITLPGSKRPSIFDFSLVEGGGTVSIRGQLQGGQWYDALGISNLKLNNVSAHINFQLGKTIRPKAFDIGISAEFDLDSTVVGVSGTCASSGQCELTAWLADFSLENLAQVYRYIFGGDLKQPDVEVTFGDFSLSLSTSTGVKATFGNIEIDKKYKIEEASVKLARDGVELRACYSGKVNVASGIDIDEAQIALSLGTGNQKSYFWINGKTSWSSASVATPLQFEVSAYFYKDKGGSSQYVLLGAVSGMDKWTFGSLLKESCPDVLSDIGLTALSMLVASSNDIELGPLKPAQYKVQKGARHYLCRSGRRQRYQRGFEGRMSGILLSASLPDFALGISLPTSEIVDFGHDIKTLPIQILLNVKQRTLSVSAGIVYNPKGGSSLEFDLILVLGLLDASATLSAKMDWTNPLGLCPNSLFKKLRS